jgi:hypothetical protein
MGEARKDALRLDFDRRLKLEFHGTKMNRISKAVLLTVLTALSLPLSAGTIQIPSEIAAMKEVAAEWFDAMSDANLPKLQSLYLPESRDKAEKNLQQMTQMLQIATDLQFGLMIVKYTDTQAEAISKPFEVNHSEIADSAVLVLHLRKHGDKWRILYHSCDVLRSVADSYDYFKRKNPEGQIWLDPKTPNWLRPAPAPAADELTVEEIFKDVPQSFPTAEIVEKLKDTIYDRSVFESWFPEDTNAGKALLGLFRDRERDPNSARKILYAARSGLRNAGRTGPYIISYLGNEFIWAAREQNADAIELIYYASYDSQLAGNAIYYGLSVIRTEKSPRILKRLVELCMIDHSVSRILWGTRGNHEQMVPYLQPWLEHSDPLIRGRATVMRDVLQGRLNYDQFQKQNKFEYNKTLLGDKIPLIRQVLATGSSFQRRELLDQIRRRDLTSLFDESFREPLLACLSDGHPEVRCRAIEFSGDLFCKPHEVKSEIIALMDELSKDSDSKVRQAVAVFTGSKWVWGSIPQDPRAVEIMIRLAGDKDRGTRNKAVYYGLSVLNEKTDPLVEMMVKLAIDPTAVADVGRIGWGLSRGADKDKIKALLEPHIKGQSEQAQRARKLYMEIFKD